MKVCSLCKETKDDHLFYKRNTKDKNKDRLKSACIECSTLKARNKYKLTATPGSQRSNNLKRTFGITVKDYEDLFKTQDYQCAICKRKRKDNEKNFAVDHSHTTGKIRGILCGTCNTSIGQLNDSIELLKEAIKYLEKYE